MEAFFNKVAAINGSINGVVWGIFGLVLLIGTGIIVTLSTGVFQVSRLGLWWKNTIGSMFTKDVMRHRKEKGVISPFQALCTALAATVGTGNIAGVAAAIAIGGAGAVFWMWVAALSREASGVPSLNQRRGLTLLSPVCRDPAIGV